MDRAYKKWGILCAIGVCFLIFTAVCFIRKDYYWIFSSFFAGIFFIITAGKRIIYLKTAERALEAGKKEILVHYRDKNLNESEYTVIPAGADTFWFYGFMTGKKDIKQFRWQGIRRVAENGKNMQRNDILEYIKSIPAKKQEPPSKSGEGPC